MNTSFHTSLSVRLIFATMAAGLLFAPSACQAQDAGNTAYGQNALEAHTSGNENTAIGLSALLNNQSGNYNTAVGAAALLSSQTGYNNTAIGVAALYSNIGYDNTANGFEALYSNYAGVYNTANGANALYSNYAGNYNVADGFNALYRNQSGNYNFADGEEALYNNTAEATTSRTVTLPSSTLRGAATSRWGMRPAEHHHRQQQHRHRQSRAAAADNGIIRIGTAGTAHSHLHRRHQRGDGQRRRAVYINANGQLGTLTSSRRFKNDIKDMGSVSDKLMQSAPGDVPLQRQRPRRDLIPPVWPDRRRGREGLPGPGAVRQAGQALHRLLSPAHPDAAQRTPEGASAECGAEERDCGDARRSACGDRGTERHGATPERRVGCVKRGAAATNQRTLQAHRLYAGIAAEEGLCNVWPSLSIKIRKGPCSSHTDEHGPNQYPG